MWVLFKYFIIEYSYCKMRRNFPHNENEKRQIFARKLEGKSISFIASELSRSQTVVRSYLKDPESDGTRKRPGHPPKIINAARRRLFREASKGQSSTRDRKKSPNLPITPRRVRQFLHESPNLVYWNKKTAAALTVKYKKTCVDWVKKKVTCTKVELETGVFWWEKGSFGWARRFPVLLATKKKRKEKHLFSERLFWGRSVMVWGTFEREIKLSSIYQCVGKKSFPIYESSRHQ